MKKSTFICLLLLPILSSSQINLNQIDDFEGFTTENWTKGNSSSLPNENILTDGPSGTDDNYLRVQSNGGSGSDSNLTTFNNSQWQGDYVDAGVTYISMDVRNSGSNVIILRLAFKNDNWTNDPKWSSTNGIAVVPGEGWQTIVFPIDENSLTRLGHNNSYNGDFGDISEVRIIHNDAPSWGGDSIEAILDIDNIQARDNDMGTVDTGEPKISLNLIDDFEGVTVENWTKGTSSSLLNQNIITDGPTGTDDNFLRVQSNGGSGSDSKLVTFNNAQWLGDYVDAGVTYISMDVRNTGSNLITLRLAFENDNWTNDPKWSSTNGIAVVPGEGWQTIIFPIDENSLTRLGHNNSYNGDFGDITEVRIIHNDAPSWEGDSIEATLDIDNIQARNSDMGLADSGKSKISLNLIDDFEGVTVENWTKGTSSSLLNQNISTDGPTGTDDNFLRVQSNGGSGSDSKLVTFNNAQWLGDYVDAGVTYISMDVRNSGSNVIILRLAFENDNWTNDPKWSSIDPIAVVPGQGWQTIVFPIDENSLTRLGHTGSYNGSFGAITEIRILHNDTPSWEADAIEAILDIDNIQARDENLSIVDVDRPSQIIKVYPIPASAFIHIEGISEEVEYLVFDINGKIVMKGKATNQNRINIQNLVKGTYFLNITSYNTFKFVKD
ncbi:T9SS type A sorting domain-containing protein [Winogradskyella bathintestinalis]|uniref:T9SS type A sorting domain-containing protein n=1 Tax=Winogradskyella bathintestinalis TaxID=3035208 RepID=A0ABT7ZXC5_9FLAO|nr:T9SS type A sorting domain-containing protein [Winogradskyella bathintestinalis]MDN3493648.1 T9SS type A sorting domain-containing protein [Winogradskyella bathintestinalis]